MQRWACALGITASLALPLIAPTDVSTAAWTVRPTFLVAPPQQEPQSLPNGISSSVLASQEAMVELPASPGGQARGPWVDMLLERIPLDPGNDVDGRDPDESGNGVSVITLAQEMGMHLLYIETGEITVATSEDETLYGEGESAFVPRPYELRNDSEECVSLLRLSVLFHRGGRGAAPSAGSGPERGCGEYELLLSDTATYPWPADQPPELAFHIFIARLRWDQPAEMRTSPYSFPGPVAGPVAMLIESGSVNFGVLGEDSVAEDVRTRLAPRGEAGIDPHVGFRMRAGPGTAVLMVGVIPADQDWVFALAQSGTGAVLGAAGAFDPGTVVITVEERVRLRAGPTIESPIIAELRQGSELTITNPPEVDPAGYAWYPVRDSDGQSGYVAGQFLTERSA